MTAPLQLSPVIQLDPALIGQIGNVAWTQLSMIAERLPGLLDAPSLLAACKQAAGEVPGLTPRSLYTRVRRYIKTRDPLDLVDRREAASLWKARQPAGLPAAFQEWYRGLREKHQRVATQAHAELLGIWRTHYDMAGRHYERIPGYETWPAANPATGVPDGWTYDNLQRTVREHPFDGLAVRQGMAAARNVQPPVRTTRVGLRLAERIEFDDHDFDVKVHFAGQSRAMRPQCFGWVDALSGWGSVSVRPMLWDDEAEKKRVLSEFQFRCFVVSLLTKHGYRTDEAGTTLVTEAGKAVIRPAFEARLAAVTGGRVKVSQGRVFAEQAHPGQYAPRGKGNPKHKPLIEGLWSVIENVLDRLPGRTGSNQRINGPADLHGRELALARSLDLARVLPPDLAQEVQLLGVMTYGQFSRVARAAIESVLEDRDHELEGWEELGFTRLEWRSDPQSLMWLPVSALAALPAPEQQALRAVLQAGGSQLTRAVRLSRREVWERGSGELQRVSPMALHRLLDPDDALEVTVTRQSMIEFQDTLRFGPGVHRFLAKATGREFYPGDKFSAFFNPLMPQWLQLVDAKGAHVALVERIEMPSKNDVDGVQRAIKRQSTWVADRKIGVAGRHFDEAEQRLHMAEHNQRLVEEAARRDPTRPTSEMNRMARRAAEAGRAMQTDAPIEGEVFDEVIEAGSATHLEPDLGDVEYIPTPLS
ncbi:MAG: hypothetical protein KF791_08475 [Verrucomicrobiae bacterium]|nr:hypothetical protein [Verrucomicrobiae bacterium]